MKAIAKLMDEHQHILKVLDALEQFASQVERNSQLNQGRLGQFVDFIAHYADAYHHAKEEDVLFKHMENYGFSRQMGPVAVMLAEHDQGRALVRKMREAAQAPLPPSEEALPQLVRSIRDYISLLRQHIYKEDHILYPMAQSHLPPQAQEALESDFQAVEEGKMASGEPARLLRLKEELLSDG